MKKVLFIASTGGHLNELMQLAPMFDKYEYHIITEKTKSTNSLVNKYGKKIDYLVYGTKDKKIVYPFKLLANCFKSLWYFIKFRPDVVVSTGSHNAGPMCLIAHLFGKKVIFIETFANSNSPTRCGKLVYKFADIFIVQWENMLKFYPKAIYGGWIF